MRTAQIRLRPFLRTVSIRWIWCIRLDHEYGDHFIDVVRIYVDHFVLDA